MRKTRRVKRKSYGTLRKSRRYKRGGSYSSKLPIFQPLLLNVRHGGKRRRTKRKSSRKKRGGTTHNHHSIRLRPSSTFFAVRPTASAVQNVA